LGAHTRRGERHGLRSGAGRRWAARRRSRRSSGRRHGWRRTRRPQSGTNACVWKRRPVVKRALAGQEDDAPFSASTCAKQPTMARPWRRGRQERNLEVRRKKRGQRPSLASRVKVRACWGARLCEGDVPARTHARTRTRRRRVTSAATTGWLRTARRSRLGKRRARVGEGGGTYKKFHPSLARWTTSQAVAARRG
jgi:hypothetical protein